MNDQTIRDLDEGIRKLNEKIISAVGFLTRSRDVLEPPLTVQDLEKAIRNLNELIHIGSDDPILYINRGNAHFYIGDYESAILDYSKIIEIYPRNATAYLKRGDAHFCKGECDLAILDYSEAIRIDPMYAKAYDSRGEVHYHLGKSNQAREDAEEAFRLGSDLHPQTDYEDYCFELINDLVQLFPKNAKVYYCRGLVHGYGNLAIADYSEAIRLDPKYAEAYHDRGTAYGTHEEDKAIADYTEAIRLYPADEGRRAEALANRGSVYEDQGTIDGYSKAIADYERAASRNSLHYYSVFDVYFRRGKLYAENGNYDRAIADMSSIIQLDDCISADYDEISPRGLERNPDAYYPFNYGSERAGQAYNDRGFYYSKKGEYDSAIADFTEVLRIYNEQVELDPHSNPDFAIVYLNLGSIYHTKGDIKLAIANYDNVVRLCPNYVTDFVNSNFAHGGSEEVDQARELLKSVSDDYYKSGDLAEAAYYEGVSFLLLPNKIRARECFEAARDEGFEHNTKIDMHLKNIKNLKS